MKKSMLTLGLVAACAFALTGCVKEIEPCTPAAEATVSEAVPFELVAGFDATKTTIDDNFKVAWAEGDAINVFHAVAGTKDYINDGKFTVKAAGFKGVFAGELAQALDAEKSYDWYIVYPYSADATSPAACPISVKNPDRGIDAGASVLAGLPLYGSTKVLAGTTAPTMNVHQVMSAIKMTFKNTSEDVISPKCVRFKSVLSGYNELPEAMIQPVGDFIVDITAESPVFAAKEGGFCPKHSTGNLPGTDNIQPGESFSTYLYIIPSTFKAGTVLELGANNGAPSKNEQLKEDLVFKAGEIKEFIINLGPEYVGEEEAADGIFFRVCMRNDDSYGDDARLAKGLADNLNGGTSGHFAQNMNPNVCSSKRWAPRFYSIKDHYTSFSDADETFYGSAYIGFNLANYATAGEFANSAGRYFMPGMNFKANDGNYFQINALYEKLAAGKTVKFYASYDINNANSCNEYKFTYSVDGGKTFKNASVAVEAEIDSFDEATGITTFPLGEATAAGKWAYCHPAVVSCPITKTVENANFILKIEPLDAVEAGGWTWIAPYYTYTAAEGLRCYTGKSFANYGDGTPVYDYIPSLVGEVNGANVKITDWGQPFDIAACAYLKVE